MDLEKYLRKKQRLQESKNEKLRLSIDGEVFEFEKLNDEKYSEIQGLIVETNNNGNSDEIVKICKDIIFFSCPELRSSELLEEIGVEYPPDIVDEIFSGAEISAAGAELMKFNGMTETDVVKKI